MYYVLKMEKLSRDSLSFLKCMMERLSNSEKDALLVALAEDKKKRRTAIIEKIEINPEIYGNKEKIIGDLRHNHVQKLLYRGAFDGPYPCDWYVFYINLPAVWCFEWFRFGCFVSEDEVIKKDNFNHSWFETEYWNYWKLENLSFTFEDIWDLLYALNRYMAEYWVETDGDFYYADKLRERVPDNGLNELRGRRGFFGEWGHFIDGVWSQAWECLQRITWREWEFWMYNKNIAWEKDNRAVVVFNNNDCYFGLRCNYGSAKRLLKIPPLCCIDDFVRKE